MVVVAGQVVIDSSKREEAIRAATSMMEATRREPGCIRYVMSADLSDEGRFWIFEEWESEEALAEHFTAPHMAAFQQTVASLGVKKMVIEKYQVTAKGPLG